MFNCFGQQTHIGSTAQNLRDLTELMDIQGYLITSFVAFVV
jgi:hypothetical protein